MDSWVCEECTIHSTLLVCCCMNPPKQICDNCFSTHKARMIGGDVHGLLPASIMDSGDDLANVLGRAKHKLVDLCNASNYLEDSLKSLKDLLSSFETSVDKLVAHIYKNRDRIKQEIKQIIDLLEIRIKYSVDRMRQHAVDRDFSPSDPLERLIWNFGMEGSRPKMVVEDWFIEFEQYTTIIIFDIKKLLIDPYLFAPTYEFTLAAFDAQMLATYDCKRAVWTPRVKLARTIPMIGYWNVFLPTGNLLHCGGATSANHPCTVNVYEIFPSDGRVFDLPPMNFARKDHGGLLDGDYIYVFGGKNTHGKLSSCERFSISACQWEFIDNMCCERLCFNPVKFQDCVYLCGGCEKSVERLDLCTGKFELVKAMRLDEESPTMAFCVSPMELCILTSTIVYVWDGNNSRRNSNYQVNSFIRTEMVPVVFNNRVYTTGWKGLKTNNFLLTDPQSLMMPA